MSGQIPLDYPFESSWLWEDENNTVWVSMIIVNENERRKGHVSRLIDSLMTKYDIVIVPEPSRIMHDMLKRRGFVYTNSPIADSFDGHYMIWKRTESKEAEQKQ